MVDPGIPSSPDRISELALAGLLHDIGKLLQRGRSPEELKHLRQDITVFCPTDSNGHALYHHAAYTAAFIDRRMKHLVPQGQGAENILGWAARHHNPKSASDWIVAEADRLSSGMDREPQDESWAGWTETVGKRLVPVLSRVSPDGPRHDFGDKRFPLVRLDTGRSSLFPESCDRSDRESATDEYAQLRKQFENEFDHLISKPEARLQTALETIQALLACYAWCVPAATNEPICDVSLYDHLRTAAAVAAALTASFLDSFGHPAGMDDATHNNPVAWIKDRSQQRYALICGDISGIQRYLHAVASRGAAKSLRGRSFMVQLLTDACARYLLRQLDMPPCNILFAGGGHFWILAPRSRADRLETYVEEADLWIADWSGGYLSFATGSAVASGMDLIQKNMSDIRDLSMRDLHQNRGRRFQRLAKAEHERIFGIRSISPRARPCRSCGQDVVELEESEQQSCRACTDAETMGRLLPKSQYLWRLAAKGYETWNRIEAGECSIFFAGPLQTGYALSKRMPADMNSLENQAAVCSLGTEMGNLPSNTGIPKGIWPVARNAPGTHKDGDYIPFSYEDLAGRSDGVPRLGVLRADVDNLGKTFRNGFSKSQASLSRLASLSWHLTLFFGGYITSIIEERDGLRDAVQIVFSGGDDLFVVGAWDRLPSLAWNIRSEFREFAAGNQQLSISAGISSGGPNDPVIRLAAEAHDAEERAKRFKHFSNQGKTKDAVSFLGRVLSWDELRLSSALARDLAFLITGRECGYFLGLGIPDPPGREILPKPLPRGLLQQLLTIADVEHRSRMKIDGAISIEDVVKRADKGRWAWLLAYRLARTADRYPATAGFIKEIRDSMATATYRSLLSQRHIIEFLEVAAAWAFIVTRKGDGKNL